MTSEMKKNTLTAVKIPLKIFSHLNYAQLHTWQMTYSCFLSNVPSAKKYLLSIRVLHCNVQRQLKAAKNMRSACCPQVSNNLITCTIINLYPFVYIHVFFIQSDTRRMTYSNIIWSLRITPLPGH